MKKNVFFWGMAAVALAFGLVLAGCDNGNTDTDDDPTPSIPALEGTVTITGITENGVIGQTLTANTDSLLGTGTIYYTWERGNPDVSPFHGYKISGATSATYQLQNADRKQKIRVTVRREGYSGVISSDDFVPLTKDLVTISPSSTRMVSKGGTQVYTVTIDEVVTNSNRVIWTVSPDTGGSTISGTGQTIVGSTTTQTRTLNVAAGESATSLTVRVIYNGEDNGEAVTAEVVVY